MYFYKNKGKRWTKNKDGDSHFENDITHISMNSYPSNTKVPPLHSDTRLSVCSARHFASSLLQPVGLPHT